MITQRTIKVYDNDRINTDINIDRVKVGDEFVLVELENLVTGDRWYRLVPDNGEGIPGNLYPTVYCYHGWRGTTNNIHKQAHGLRKVVKVTKPVFDKREYAYYIKITVGRDLHPDWD